MISSGKSQLSEFCFAYDYWQNGIFVLVVSFTIFTFPLNTLLKAMLITLSAKGVDSSNSSFTLQKLFNIYHLRLCNATDG